MKYSRHTSKKVMYNRKRMSIKPKDLYKTKAWEYCSRYVLLFHSLDGLNVFCWTCGKPLQVNLPNCHCGHLIKVTDSMATALEFTNLGPQCLNCNRYQGGRQDLMKEKLIKVHGHEAIEKLYIKRHNICKLGDFELDIWKAHYKPLFDQMVDKYGNPWKKSKTVIRKF